MFCTEPFEAGYIAISERMKSKACAILKQIRRPIVFNESVGYRRPNIYDEYQQLFTFEGIVMDDMGEEQKRTDWYSKIRKFSSDFYADQNLEFCVLNLPRSIDFIPSLFFFLQIRFGGCNNR